MTGDPSGEPSRSWHAQADPCCSVARFYVLQLISAVIGDKHTKHQWHRFLVWCHLDGVTVWLLLAKAAHAAVQAAWLCSNM